MDLLERFDTATEGGPEQPVARVTDRRGPQGNGGAGWRSEQPVWRRSRSIGAGWAMVPGGSMRVAEVTGSTTEDGSFRVRIDEEPGSSPGKVEEFCRIGNTTGDVGSYRQAEGADPGDLDLTRLHHRAGRRLDGCSGNPLPDEPCVGFVDGVLTPAPGVVIVDTIRNPDVEGFAGPGAEAATGTRPTTWCSSR